VALSSSISKTRMPVPFIAAPAWPAAQQLRPVKTHWDKPTPNPKPTLVNET